MTSPSEGPPKVSSSQDIVPVKQPVPEGTLSGRTVTPKEEGMPVALSTLENTQFKTTNPLSKTLPKKELSKAYGNKTANLYVVDQLCKEIKGVRAVVPPFLGISHNDVLTILRREYENFEEDWKQFAAFQSGETALTPKGKKQLGKIRENILKAFAKGSLNIENVKKFLSESRDPLMVRSSGIEDTKKGAMAGANESVAGVEPKEQDTLNAMGTVVASYFSEQSLAQRTLAGKEITESPLMPVLLQVMIGEDSNSDEILSCGVCYTREMGGETPDLTMIEAAYGHNEGVVNGNVRTDVYYVYPDGSSHEVIAPKTDRLVAQKAEKGEDFFVREDNPRNIASKPALSPLAQQKLQKVSEAIHDHYGMPMDIEWVYSPRSDTFFIVQARPIKEMPQKLPRTIDKEEFYKKGGVLQKGDKIVGRGGRNVVVNQPNQVIKAKTMEDALDQYLAIDQKCRKQLPKVENPVRAVVVERSGEGGELSHAGCVFQENDIVAFCAPSYSTQGLNQGKAHIFDLQDSKIGEISIPPGIDDPEKHLEEIGVLKEGWKKHTIPGMESVKTLEIAKEEYDALLKDYSPDLPKNLTMGELLDNIASPNPEMSSKAVKDLAFILRRRIERVSKLSDPASQAALPRLKRLFNNIVVIAKDVVNRPEAMQRLHAAKRIEAMMTQEASPFVIESDSFIVALAELKEGQGIAIPQSGLDEANQKLLKNLEAKTASALKGQHPEKLFTPMTEEEKYSCLLVYRALSKYALTEETKAAWQQLTDQVAASGSKIANRFLIDMVVRLDELGVLADWMNDNFAKRSSDAGPIFLLDDLRKEFSGITGSMRKISQFQSALEIWEGKYGDWEDPSDFDVVWDQFESEVVFPLDELSEQFIESDKRKMTSLEKRIFLKAITQGVDVFDKSIKAMKGSSQYRDQTQVKLKRFARMLSPYRDLMILWFAAIPENDFRKWIAATVSAIKLRENLVSVPPVRDVKLRLQKNIIRKFNDLEEKIIKNQGASLMLLPSKDFNVQAATIDSGADLQARFLEKGLTLEDLFTFFHQNILAAISPHQDFIDFARIPETMTSLLESLGKISTSHGFADKIKSQVLAVDLGFPILSAKINIPIRCHSVVLDIAYDLKTQETRVSFHMFGDDLGDRMSILSRKAVLSLCEIEGMTFEEAPEFQESFQALNFSVKLAKDFKDFNALSEMVINACKDSLEGNIGVINMSKPQDLLKGDPQVLDKFIGDRRHLRICSTLIPAIFDGLISGERYEEAIKLMRTFEIDTSSLSKSNFIDSFPRLMLREVEKGSSFKTLENLMKALFSEDQLKKSNSAVSLFIAEFMKEGWENRLMGLIENPSNKPIEWLLEPLTSHLVMNNQKGLDIVLDALKNSKRITELLHIIFVLRSSPAYYQKVVATLQEEKVPGVQASGEEVANGQDIKDFTQLKKGDKVLYLHEKRWKYADVLEVKTTEKQNVVLSLGEGAVKLKLAQVHTIKVLPRS